MKKQGKCTLDKAHWVLCAEKTFHDMAHKSYRIAMGFEYHDHACDYARELVSKLVSKDKLGEVFKIDRRNNWNEEFSISVSEYGKSDVLKWTLCLSVRAVFGTGSETFEELVIS